MSTLQYEIRDQRAVLTLDKPERRNALGLDLATEIRDAIADVASNDARCVIIQGSGDAFCSGGDIDSMMQGLSSDADLETMVEEGADPVNRVVQDIYRCSLPTIAKVDGPAYGAGASLAVACDIVLASDRAEFSFGFQRIGLSIDSGTSYLLPRLVGEKIAMRLVLTDDVVDGGEALELGLATRQFPSETFESDCEELVEEIASGPTVALSHSKQLVQEGLDRSISDAIDHEIESLTEVFATQDFSEGVAAFVADREPEFTGE
jgi:enoyl-CoA hydratase/carnithine racemase